jgi:hypothetical protein
MRPSADRGGRRAEVPFVAHCHFALGELFLKGGHRESAREHLAMAKTLYGEMDMRGWQAQADAEMQGLE